MGTRSLQNGQIQVQMTGQVRNVLDDGTTANGSLSAILTSTLTSGADENQANRAWQWKNKTLAQNAFQEFLPLMSSKQNTLYL